jgi:hypothetical protein
VGKFFYLNGWREAPRAWIGFGICFRDVKADISSKWIAKIVIAKEQNPIPAAELDLKVAGSKMEGSELSKRTCPSPQQEEEPRQA